MRRFTSQSPLLLLALFLSHRWSSNSLSFALNISWVKPAAGDVYGSGSHLEAQWQSDSPVTTPSFQLCNGASSEFDGSGAGSSTQCGDAVQPSVAKNADGSYQAILAAPEVVQTGYFVLQMFTDTGFEMMSPTFTLSPSTDDPAPSPSPAIHSDDAGNPDTTLASPRSMPNLAQSHSPASTAAYAVPLSLAGSIILVASVICALQRRKLLHERAVSQEESKVFQNIFNGGRSQNVGHSTSGEPAHALAEIPLEEEEEEKELQPRGSDIYTRPYVPHFAKERRPRTATREPFSTIVTGRATVPAGYFKATLSPRMPYQAAQSPGTDRIYPFHAPRSEPTQEFNAAVNERVITDYLQPSPIPPSLTPAPLQQVHLRQQASLKVNLPDDNMDSVYEEVTRRLT